MRTRTSVAVALLTALVACTPSSDSPRDAAPPDLWAGLEAPEERPAPSFSFERAPTPPPRPTERKTELFGPGQAPTKPDGPTVEALQVLRTLPTGEVGLTATASVTFNQPMVPLAALDALDAQEAPLTITPSVPGRFRWLGTRTVEFEPEGRFPLSTRYTATVPAGTAALSGQALAEAVTFEFETERLQVERSWSRGTITPDALLALTFNQRIDLAQLAPHITLTHGAQKIALEVVEQLPEESPIRKAGADLERTIALRPTQPLPLDTTFQLTVQASAPSAEGPLPMDTAWTTTLSTYAPMTIKEVLCGWSEDTDRCPARRGVQVRFSNPLEPRPLDELLTITPRPPGEVAIFASDQYAVIQADFAPATIYTIELGAGVQDVYAQTSVQGVKKTLRFGDLTPELKLDARQLALIESKGPRALPLSITNLDQVIVQAAHIEPQHLWRASRHATRRYQYNWSPFQPEFLKVSLDKTLAPGLKRNVPGRVGVPLDPALGDRASGLLYLVARAPKLDGRGRKHHLPLVVQVTDIGLAVRYDLDHLHVLANRLSTGEPVEADLRLLDRDGEVVWAGRTDAEGYAEGKGRRAFEGSPQGPFTLVATDGEQESVVLINGSGVSGSVWAYNGTASDHPTQRIVGRLTTDRNIYRPGETVHVRGVFRDVGSRTGVRALPPALRKVTYSVFDGRGLEVVKDGEVELTDFDTFAIDLDLPGDVALGYLQINGSVADTMMRGSTFTHSVRIEEYRAPEFEVSAALSPEGLTLGETLRARITASYLFGAPMRDAAVRWSLSRGPTAFTPPNQAGFHFGVASSSRDILWMGFGGEVGERTTFAEGAGRLTDAGELTFERPVAPPSPTEGDEDDEDDAPKAEQLRLSATVTGANQQEISASASLIAHPASFYAGVKLDRRMYSEGQTATLSAVAASPDGERVIGRPLKVSVVQQQMKRELVQQPGGGYRYDYTSQEEVVGACDLKSAADPVDCDVRLPRAGYFLARVTATDEGGRPVRTDHGFYVTGEGYIPWRQDKGFEVELITDRPDYKVGDTARILVKSPFKEARGLLTVERDGVVERRVVHIQGSASTLDIPLREAWLPGVTVALVLVRGRVEVEGVDASDTAQDLGRPAFAHGQVSLSLDTAPRRLSVDVTPSAEALAPGESLTVGLKVADASGQGVESEVALYVVDEAVLSLLGYDTPDLLPHFHSNWSANTALRVMHNDLLKREPELEVKKLKGRSMEKLSDQLGALGYIEGESTGLGLFGATGAGRGGGGMGWGGGGLAGRSANVITLSEDAIETDESEQSGFESAPIQARTSFLTTAYANQRIVTDARGQAEVTVPLPENLTTWRVMAIAVDRGDKFGSGQAQVTTRKPLLLRPALPRFASYGDRFEAGVIVNNETGADVKATVGLRGTGFTVGDAAPQEVTVKAGAAAEVRFPVEATTTGEAVFQFVVRAGEFADAAEVSIPVHIPVTTEAFATYGTTEASVAQPVQVPEGVIPSWGGLEVAMSSTALTGLEDAARYLHLYRYGCLEQTASRLIPLVTLGPVLDDFQIEGLASPEARDAASAALVTRLLQMQRRDGGFAFWPGASYAAPYATTYALWALHRASASASGVAIPEHVFTRGASYLTRRLRYETRRWGEWYGLTTRAQAAFVLGLMKQPAAHNELRELYSKRASLATFSRLHLLGAMHLIDPDRYKAERLELRRLIDNAVVETPSTVHFSEGRHEGLGLVMHSSTRTDAIGLLVLLQVAPSDPLVPKIIRGLMDARQATGTWGNTQENALIVAAMADYYAAWEKETPDYTAQIWYGDGYLGQEAFKGRSTDVAESLIPMRFLAEAGDRDVLLAKEGPGRLYYRLGLRYAPADPNVEARSEGFTVQRTYAPAQGEPEESVVKTDAGWRVKVGTNLEVKLTIVVHDRGYHVAVDDPLPAGLEAVNTRFKTTASHLGEAVGTRRERGWGWATFNHIEQRDERVILFARALPAGVYHHTYVARATTPGTFTLPPLRAEQMYAPESFGRTATQTVEVIP